MSAVTVDTSLALPVGLLDELSNNARMTAHTEICGFIARSEQAFSRYPIPNIATCPTRYFEMAPLAQLSAFERMRQADESLIAIYHSHPTGAAIPSATDLQSHHYPAAAALILAPQSVHKPVRAWRLRNNSKVELAIKPVKASWRDVFAAV